ncbi:winged helix-turn-helix domain-containing protein [Streptomyces sp. NBC_00035]|uniref:winged helix-turn-helix domain-containing protein n=1 Tax=Streptomyces sp. NBC_00035 TaxID=2903614 RepID=UPI00324C74BF
MHQRFGVDCTLAGVDLLLHRSGWSVQVPARRAAEGPAWPDPSRAGDRRGPQRRRV